MGALVAAALVLAVVTVLSRRPVAHPAWGWLRVLVPSWRFFDRVAGSPRLLLRTHHDGVVGPWAPIDDDRRTWWTWAFAPGANLALAGHAAIERLVNDVDSLAASSAGLAVATDADGALAAERDPAVLALAAWHVVADVARAQVAPGVRFEWKIVVPDDDGGMVDYLRAAPEVA